MLSIEYKDNLFNSYLKNIGDDMLIFVTSKILTRVSLLIIAYVTNHRERSKYIIILIIGDPSFERTTP